jgi:hydroxymethylglutaryl-CoA reductase
LTTVGIQAGHMKMHLTNIVASMQGSDEEIELAKKHFEDKVVTVSAVRLYLESLRK